MDNGGAVIGLLIVIGIVALVVHLVRKHERKEEAAAYAASIERQIRSMMSGDRATLPLLEPHALGYRRVGKENVHAVQNGARRLEYKSQGYSTRGASVSIPIMKGVRYRVGSGSITPNKAWQTTAQGRLLLTDKAFVFESPEKNERITWSQIANVEILADGFQLAKRSGPPRLFAVDQPDPGFAATLEVLLHRAN